MEFSETTHLTGNKMQTLSEIHSDYYRYEFILPMAVVFNDPYSAVPICKLETSVSLDKIAHPIEIVFTIKLVTGLHRGFLLDYDVQLIAGTDFRTDNTIDLIAEIVATPLHYVTASASLDIDTMQLTINKVVNTMAERVENTLEDIINVMETRWQEEIYSQFKGTDREEDGEISLEVIQELKEKDQ